MASAQTTANSTALPGHLQAELDRFLQRDRDQAGHRAAPSHQPTCPAIRSSSAAGSPHAERDDAGNGRDRQQQPPSAASCR